MPILVTHQTIRQTSLHRLLLLALLLAPTVTHADTIYLKSGLALTVTAARENDGQIEYWIGRDHYTISKDRVLKIEKGDAPVTPPSSTGPATGVQDLTRRTGTAPSTPSQHDKVNLPLLAVPKQNDAYWSGLRDQFVIRDTISDQRLAEIELDHNNRKTSDAYFLAAVIEIERSHFDQASRYLDRAIRAMPDRVELLEWQAIVQTRNERYAEATQALERANALRPGSPEILRQLGMTLYNTDRTSDAIAAWKRAQELSPDPQVAALLHKAEREMQVEEKLKSKESRHFTLHYEGSRTPPEMQQQILATLESAYQDISRQLTYEPRENIIVILYTQKEFTDITQAPAWSGALNDGKLRIPIGGLTAMQSLLERTLRHELTHSFVHSLGGPHCPVWLQEGLAQLMEPKSARAYAAELGPLLAERKAVPFPVLEQSFMRFNTMQAEIAYAQSLAAVEFLRDRYGVSEIVRMLESIASGVEPETALTNSTGLNYSVFQERIGQYLTGR